MPRGSPFTQLCQSAARLSRSVVADLHVHTTASDGDFTADQVIAAARAAGVDAVAVTDHDTTAGVAAAVAAADRLGRGRLRVVPGAEVSAAFEGREVHILGLFVRPDDPALTTVLDRVCDGRRVRFREFVARIPELKPIADAGAARLVEAATASPGRRHVAGLLVRSGVAKTWNEAFYRFLGPVTASVTPKPLIPVGDAIELIRGAGGVASLAHPRPDVDEAALARLRDVGLGAVEANFPAAALGRSVELRGWANRLRLGVTGGSDFHSPDPAERRVGSRGLTADEWDALREFADGAGAAR